MATATAGATLQALLHELAGHAAANLASPFGTQALVWDVRVAQLTERAQVTAYLAAAARKQAQTQAFLAAMAANRARSVPPATAVRSAPAAAPRDPWPALRQCESGGNYAADTGNGYYGAYQFNLGTWRSLGFGGLPSQAVPAQQDQAAQELEARRGWDQWPSCARRLGLP
jgi:hypothetical protein